MCKSGRLRGMKYVLYGDKGSGSGPVEMALAVAGAEVELREVPLEGDHQLRAEYLELNPMGRLPTLVLPGGAVMTESFAILVTLADLHPDASLLPPPDEPGRAKALRWMALLAGEFYPHVTRYDYPERFGVAADQVQALKWRAQEMGREVMRIVEQHADLTGEPAAPFLLGARFSVADIYLAVLSRWMGGRVWTAENLPKLEVLARAVATRPQVAPVWERHGLG
jgi:GST-like protein